MRANSEQAVARESDEACTLCGRLILQQKIRRNQSCANYTAEVHSSATVATSKFGSRFEPARLRRPRLAPETAPRRRDKTTHYGSNYRASERGGKPPAERLRSTVRNDESRAPSPGEVQRQRSTAGENSLPLIRAHPPSLRACCERRLQSAARPIVLAYRPQSCSRIAPVS